jgi:mono/diheme cytochrome c family protein
MMRGAVLVVGILATSAFGLAVAAQPEQEKRSDWASPGGSAVQARTAATPAEALYVEKCSMCHRQMGMGTVILARRLGPDKAILENRNDLIAAYIQVVVRTGAGNMPRITRGEVSDQQLATITEHLLRKRQP